MLLDLTSVFTYICSPWQYLEKIIKNSTPPDSVTLSALVLNVSSVPCSQMLQLMLFTTVGGQFPHPYPKVVVNNTSYFHKFLNIDYDVCVFVCWKCFKKMYILFVSQFLIMGIIWNKQWNILEITVQIERYSIAFFAT